MAKGTIERKCLKGHHKAEGRCSSRCLRWYPRIERRATEGRRKFDYLGGYRPGPPHKRRWTPPSSSAMTARQPIPHPIPWPVPPVPR